MPFVWGNPSHDFGPSQGRETLESLSRILRGQSSSRSYGRLRYQWDSRCGVDSRECADCKGTQYGASHTLMPAGPIAWLSTVFSSTHPRPSPLQTIRLTHLFFDMSGIGSLL